MQCHTFVGGVKRRKRAWPTRRAARIGLRKAAQRYGFDAEENEVYRCKECRKYHYGRKLESREEESSPLEGGLSYA